MALIELAASIGYTGDEVKQFVAEERKKIEDQQDRESTSAWVRTAENWEEYRNGKITVWGRNSKGNGKLRLEAEAKKQIETEIQKAEAQKETERLRLEAETNKKLSWCWQQARRV